MEYLLLVLFIIIGYYFLTKPRFTKRTKFKEFYKTNYAHRGLHDNNVQYGENTLQSFEKAIGNNYGFELDVQITKDKKIVVFHDYNLVRSSDVNKEIDQMTYDELKDIPIYNNQRIPLLSDVLTLNNGQVPMIIEIKQKGADCLTTILTAEILDRYTGEYCIESFNPLVLNWYRKNRTDIIRGQLSTKFKKNDTSFILKTLLPRMVFNAIARPDFIACEYIHKNRLSFLIQEHLFKTPIVLWTIKGNNDYKSFKDNYLLIFEKNQ